MSHHRDHAIGFLNATIGIDHFIQVTHPKFVAEIPAETADQESSINYIKVGLTRTRVKVLKAIAMLSDVNLPVNKLFEVRRLINQPQEEPRDVASISALREMQVITEVVRNLPTLATNENLNLFNEVVFRFHTIWFLLDRALWHINDAIREEYYEDPDAGFVVVPPDLPVGKIELKTLLGEVIELGVSYAPVGRFDLFGRVTETPNKKQLLIGRSTFTADTVVSVIEAPVKYEVELGLDSL